MIAIRGLAVAATLGVAAIAVAPRGAADPQRETFSVSFHYDAAKPALDNYLSFARQSERACTTPGALPLAQRQTDRACVENLLDQLVNRIGRPELAEVHEIRTGRRADSSRTLAAR